MGRTRAIVVVVVGLALTAGCGSGGAEAPPGTPAGSSSPTASASTTPSASASPSPSPSLTNAAPSGTLKTKIDCTTVTLGAGLKRASAGPEVLCAFESTTDYVSFTVSRQQAPTFKTARIVEQGNSKGKVVIEQVAAEGWTFGAQWPPNGALTRVQRWLVDADGQVLLCKMGSDRGDAGIAELIAVCDQAKAKLYTP